MLHLSNLNMKSTLALLVLSSVFGPANAALRNSNVLVIASDESKSTHDTPKPVEDLHSFLSDLGSSTTACDPKCVGIDACTDVNQQKVGCGSCNSDFACYGSTATIGNGSCNAPYACMGTTGYIENDQCNGKYCIGKHISALSLYKFPPFEGGCKDYNGKYFSNVRIETTHLSEDSAEACAQFCRQPSLINEFQVGIQFGRNQCRCNYREGQKGGLPSSIPDGASKDIKEGYGPVARGNDFPGVKCYPLKGPR